MLAVCIPSTGYVHIHWATFFKKLRFPEPYRIFVDTLPDLAASRNRLVKLALEKGADRILFIDSDTVPHRVVKAGNGKLELKFDENAVLTLMENDAPIVSGLYPLKKGVWSAAVYDRERGEYRFLERVRYGERIKADAIGLGFALIDAEVFRSIEPPWFVFAYDAETFKIVEGEDGYFSGKAREKGFDIVVDTRIVCLHIAEVYMYEPKKFAPLWTSIEGI